MIRLTSILLTLLAMFGCQPKDITPTDAGTAQVFIDGQKESGLPGPVDISKGCGGFTINSIDFKNTSPIYNLTINLNPNGRLMYLTLRTHEGRRYETQRFDPGDALSITNFTYDTLVKKMAFDIKGKLITEKPNDSLTISGHFENVPVRVNKCNWESSTLSAEVQERSVSFGIETLAGSTAVSTILDGKNQKTYSQRFMLTNSFSLGIESAVSFSKLPVGSYKIGAPNSMNVSLQQYKGLSDRRYYNIFVQKDWRDFAVDGTLTITRQYRVDSHNYTDGTFSFQAVNTADKVQYVIKRGTFTFTNLD